MVDKKKFITNSTFIITLLLLVTGIIFNIKSASQIDSVYKYGKREKSECGIEYLEYNSPNYHVYNLINGSKHLSNNMLYAFTLVKVAWFVLITGMVIILILDLNEIRNDTVNYTQKIIKTTSGILILLGLAYLYYIIGTNILGLSPYQSIGLSTQNQQSVTSSRSAYDFFLKFKNQIQTADIGKPITNSSDFVKMYLPSTLLILIPLLWLLYIKNLNVDSKYIIYITLYVLTIIIAIEFYKTSINVLSIFNNVYEPLKDNINTQISNILPSPPVDFTKVPSSPPQSYQDKLLIEFIQNIKSTQTTDGDNFILSDYTGTGDKSSIGLWAFINHQNGNELNDILNFNTTTANDSNLAKYIGSIRTSMRALRNDTQISGAITHFTRSTLTLAITIIGIILFGIFHAIYNDIGKPVTASVTIVSLIILFGISGPFYGWITSLINKTY
jgi:hypothetical protein